MVTWALGRHRSSLENVIPATKERKNAPFLKHIVFVNRCTPPASDPKSEILEFIPKPVCPQAVLSSTESENNCAGCLFLSLHLSLCSLLVGDSWIWLKQLPTSALWLGNITGMWFWSRAHINVEPGKAESSSAVFLFLSSKLAIYRVTSLVQTKDPRQWNNWLYTDHPCWSK